MSTPILDELAQVLSESAVARTLYRQAQLDKAEGKATQAEVNELNDDFEHLVRYSNYLLIKAKADLLSAELPQIDPDEAVEAIRERLYARLEEVANG